MHPVPYKGSKYDLGQPGSPTGKQKHKYYGETEKYSAPSQSWGYDQDAPSLHLQVKGLKKDQGSTRASVVKEEKTKRQSKERRFVRRSQIIGREAIQKEEGGARNALQSEFERTRPKTSL